MDQKNTMEDAVGFISKQLDLAPEKILPNQELKSLGMDSFRIIELVLFLERRTGLSFPDHAYTPENLKSLDSIVTCFMNLNR
ncbi:MAG: acyl carrier protein [Bacteroidetes bacterium]|nr:acyl carrier protein [Bacteroidota bacterium]